MFSILSIPLLDEFQGGDGQPKDAEAFIPPPKLEDLGEEPMPELADEPPDEIPELPPAPKYDLPPLADDPPPDDMGFPTDEMGFPGPMPVHGAGSVEVTQTDSGVIVGVSEKPDYGDGQVLGDEGFWAEITGNAEADSPAQNRWVYAWQEVKKTTAGYGDYWEAVTNGKSGTTSENPARNTIENMNTGENEHIEGNGVDPENLDTDTHLFEVKPCTTGNVVRMQVAHVRATSEVPHGGTEYWFGYVNGVDGECK